LFQYLLQIIPPVINTCKNIDSIEVAEDWVQVQATALNFRVLIQQRY
jgi:hypothetical protein